MNAMKTARFFRGISQAQLAQKIGVDPTIISRLESGLFRNTPAVIRWKKKVAEVLETPVEVLFRNSGNTGGD